MKKLVLQMLILVIGLFITTSSWAQPIRQSNWPTEILTIKQMDGNFKYYGLTLGGITKEYKMGTISPEYGGNPSMDTGMLELGTGRCSYIVCDRAGVGEVSFQVILNPEAKTATFIDPGTGKALGASELNKERDQHADYDTGYTFNTLNGDGKITIHCESAEITSGVFSNYANKRGPLRVERFNVSREDKKVMIEYVDFAGSVQNLAASPTKEDQVLYRGLDSTTITLKANGEVNIKTVYPSFYGSRKARVDYYRMLMSGIIVQVHDTDGKGVRDQYISAVHLQTSEGVKKYDMRTMGPSSSFRGTFDAGLLTLAQGENGQTTQSFIALDQHTGEILYLATLKGEPKSISGEPGKVWDVTVTFIDPNTGEILGTNTQKSLKKNEKNNMYNINTLDGGHFITNADGRGHIGYKSSSPLTMERFDISEQDGNVVINYTDFRGKKYHFEAAKNREGQTLYLYHGLDGVTIALSSSGEVEIAQRDMKGSYNISFTRYQTGQIREQRGDGSTIIHWAPTTIQTLSGPTRLENLTVSYKKEGGAVINYTDAAGSVVYDASSTGAEQTLYAKGDTEIVMTASGTVKFSEQYKDGNNNTVNHAYTFTPASGIVLEHTQTAGENQYSVHFIDPATGGIQSTAVLDTKNEQVNFVNPQAPEEILGSTPLIVTTDVNGNTQYEFENVAAADGGKVDVTVDPQGSVMDSVGSVTDSVTDSVGSVMGSVMGSAMDSMMGSVVGSVVGSMMGSVVDSMMDSMMGSVTDSVSQPSDSQPSDSQPSYSQPSYSQPSYSQPSSSDSQPSSSDSQPSSSDSQPSSSDSQPSSSDSQPSYSQPSSSDSQPSYSQPSDSQSSDSQPSSSDSQPSYSQPSDSQSSDSQPSDSQPSVMDSVGSVMGSVMGSVVGSVMGSVGSVGSVVGRAVGSVTDSVVGSAVDSVGSAVGSAMDNQTQSGTTPLENLAVSYKENGNAVINYTDAAGSVVYNQDASPTGAEQILYAKGDTKIVMTESGTVRFSEKSGDKNNIVNHAYTFTPASGIVLEHTQTAGENQYSVHFVDPATGGIQSTAVLDTKNEQVNFVNPQAPEEILGSSKPLIVTTDVNGNTQYKFENMGGEGTIVATVAQNGNILEGSYQVGGEVASLEIVAQPPSDQTMIDRTENKSRKTEQNTQVLQGLGNNLPPDVSLVAVKGGNSSLKIGSAINADGFMNIFVSNAEGNITEQMAIKEGKITQINPETGLAISTAKPLKIDNEQAATINLSSGESINISFNSNNNIVSAIMLFDSPSSVDPQKSMDIKFDQKKIGEFQGTGRNY